MKEKKKLKLKKFYLHPITSFILLTIIVVLLSGILSLFEIQGTYTKIDSNGQLDSVLVTVENLLNYDGMKYIISNAARTFISFAPLSMLLIALIGVSVSQSTGLLDTVMKRHINKLDNKTITFLVLLLAIISSLINEIGYVILIPLAAIIYKSNNRNPFAGIIAAFCGVAFGYGVTVFVGSLEVSLIPYTTTAARLIDEAFHVSLTANLYLIIAMTLLLSFIGTIILEKIVFPKLGKYHTPEQTETYQTEELDIIGLEDEEQQKIAKEKREKKGLRYALVIGFLVVIAFIYMIIPNLPGSGMLLDMTEKTYLNQLFGVNSYFQDGFTYMIAILFLLMGIAYGIGAKTIKNDKDIINGATTCLHDVGGIILVIFFASQFIAIFKKTNIGTILTAWGAELINNSAFSGLPLILLVILVIAISNLFITTPSLKWSILSPVVVPMLMQSNISPQFAQVLLRAGDSMTNGITPLLAYFAIYIGYLNMYNQNKNHPITISKGIRLVMPYCLLISAAWVLLTLGWYLLGLPLGPNVLPTI